MGDDGDSGRYSVAFPRRWWYPTCRSSELTRRPRAVTLMDLPLVLFRDGGGRARALTDRCPHRNAPLSLGTVHTDGCLECAYHGWRFDGDGRCRAVPGRTTGDAAAPVRDAPAHATREQDGFVWVWGDGAVPPAGDPFALPELTGRGAGEVVFPCDLDCTLHAALENSLDVPHTAFLHRGLFRGGEPTEIVAVRDEVPGGVEVQYLGEPIGFGPVRRRPGSGLTFDHWDRFFLPSIAQIEYRVPGWLRIVNTILHLPLSPFRTRAWFVVRFWTRAPASVVRPVVLARGRQILRQDARILAAQSENVRRFGGERYASTDLDLIGNAIWLLLRRAVQAERDGGPAATPGQAEEPALSHTSVTFTV